jgi:hypothetical protein
MSSPLIVTRAAARAWVLATALALGLLPVSCSHAPPPRRYAHIDLQKQEIQDLSMQIQQWRVDMGLRPRPETTLIQRYSEMPNAQLHHDACELEGDPPETCYDVCNLSEAICDNADTICHLAEALPDDAWAAGKCDTAKASCKEAQRRCCGCQHDAGAPSSR